VRWWAAFVMGAVVGGGGVALGVRILASEPDPTLRVEAEPPEVEEATGPTELEAQLDIERVLREELTEEIARLEAELAAAKASPKAPASDLPPGLDEAVANATDARARKNWFDAGRLEGLPFRPDEIDRIREQWEAYTLARLYEQDRNAREPQRPGAERIASWQAVDEQAREELGTRGYDAMLWAAHMPNRVVVREVIGDSPATRAGLKPGDQILEYGDRRLWRPNELQDETKNGVGGEPVMMSVLRDDELLRVPVKRGPLGVQVMGQSKPPWLD